MKTTTFLERDVEKLKVAFKDLPAPVSCPALVVISGLPGTGKSYFSQKLAERAPFLIIESDALRQILFPAPSFSAEESFRLFAAIHTLVNDYLSRGISVILDATNLLERHREILYSIAERQEAKLVIVRVKAPEDLVQKRLETREKGLGREGTSRADWTVYEKMRPTVEEIKRQHFVLDTSRDINPVIEKVLKEIKRRKSWT